MQRERDIDVWWKTSWFAGALQEGSRKKGWRVSKKGKRSYWWRITDVSIKLQIFFEQDSDRRAIREGLGDVIRVILEEEIVLLGKWAVWLWLLRLLQYSEWPLSLEWLEDFDKKIGCSVAE